MELPWFTAYCASLDIAAESRSALQRFAALLHKWNGVHRLIGPSDDITVFDKHIADSVSLLPLCKCVKSLIDLGCGAGLPGLVIAILQPQMRVVLVDALHKKIAFCQTAIRELGLTNATAHCARVEAPDFQVQVGTFDVVVSRATWALAEYIPLALPYCAPGGSIIAMKGVKWEEEVAAAQPAIEANRLTLEPAQRYTLPYSGDPRWIVALSR